MVIGMLTGWIAEGVRETFGSPRRFAFYVVLPLVLIHADPAHAEAPVGWTHHWLHTGFPTGAIGSGLSWLWGRISEGAGYPLWFIEGYRW